MKLNIWTFYLDSDAKLMESIRKASKLIITSHTIMQEKEVPVLT